MVAKTFVNEDLVWAKMRGFPPWPGRICNPPKETKPKKAHHYVFFYGSENFAWIQDEAIELHDDSLVEKYTKDQKRPANYLDAVQKIIVANKSKSKSVKNSEKSIHEFALNLKSKISSANGVINKTENCIVEKEGKKKKKKSNQGLEIFDDIVETQNNKSFCINGISKENKVKEKISEKNNTFMKKNLRKRTFSGDSDVLLLQVESAKKPKHETTLASVKKKNGAMNSSKKLKNIEFLNTEKQINDKISVAKKRKNEDLALSKSQKNDEIPASKKQRKDEMLSSKKLKTSEVTDTKKSQNTQMIGAGKQKTNKMSVTKNQKNDQARMTRKMMNNKETISKPQKNEETDSPKKEIDNIAIIQQELDEINESFNLKSNKGISSQQQKNNQKTFFKKSKNKDLSVKKQKNEGDTLALNQKNEATILTKEQKNEYTSPKKQKNEVTSAKNVENEKTPPAKKLKNQEITSSKKLKNEVISAKKQRNEEVNSTKKQKNKDTISSKKQKDEEAITAKNQKNKEIISFKKQKNEEASSSKKQKSKKATSAEKFINEDVISVKKLEDEEAISTEKPKNEDLTINKKQKKEETTLVKKINKKETMTVKKQKTKTASVKKLENEETVSSRKLENERSIYAEKLESKKAVSAKKLGNKEANKQLESKETISAEKLKNKEAISVKKLGKKKLVTAKMLINEEAISAEDQKNKKAVSAKRQKTEEKTSAKMQKCEGTTSVKKQKNVVISAEKQKNEMISANKPKNEEAASVKKQKNEEITRVIKKKNETTPIKKQKKEERTSARKQKNKEATPVSKVNGIEAPVTRQQKNIEKSIDVPVTRQQKNVDVPVTRQQKNVDVTVTRGQKSVEVPFTRRQKSIEASVTRRQEIVEVPETRQQESVEASSSQEMKPRSSKSEQNIVEIPVVERQNSGDNFAFGDISIDELDQQIQEKIALLTKKQANDDFPMTNIQKNETPHTSKQKKELSLNKKQKGEEITISKRQKSKVTGTKPLDRKKKKKVTDSEKQENDEIFFENFADDEYEETIDSDMDELIDVQNQIEKSINELPDIEVSTDSDSVIFREFEKQIDGDINEFPEFVDLGSDTDDSLKGKIDTDKEKCSATHHSPGGKIDNDEPICIDLNHSPVLENKACSESNFYDGEIDSNITEPPEYEGVLAHEIDRINATKKDRETIFKNQTHNEIAILEKQRDGGVTVTKKPKNFQTENENQVNDDCLFENENHDDAETLFDRNRIRKESRLKVSVIEEPYPPEIALRAAGMYPSIIPNEHEPASSFPDILHANEIIQYAELSPTQKRIGFLGLGKIGQMIVKNLLHSGHSVTVWNRTKSKCENFFGAEIAMTPNDVVISCDIIFCCLANSAASKEVFFGPSGVSHGLRAAAATGESKGFVELTTVDPETSIAFNLEVNAKGGRYLEAQLNGSKEQADKGHLLIVASGNRSLFEDAQSCLVNIGKTSIYLSDEIGVAATYNTIHNMLYGTVYVALAESFALIEKLGLEKDMFIDAFSHPNFKRLMELDRTQVAGKNQFPANTPLIHIQKSLNTALILGNTVAQPMRVGAAANEVYKHCRGLNYENDDVSAVFEGVKR